MGGWRGMSNTVQFNVHYPKAKRIVIKRDIRDTIAVQLGRKPLDINFRTNNLNNKTFDSIINSGEIAAYAN